MQVGNTFTYKQSELPSLTPEMKGEIVAIDYQIADLSLKIQGNYHALNELAEVLDNNLDSCQMALNSIRIVPDSYENQPVPDISILPIEQKQMIFDNLFASSIVTRLLIKITGLNNEEIGEIIDRAWNEQVKDLPAETIHKALAVWLEQQKSKPSGIYNLKI